MSFIQVTEFPLLSGSDNHLHQRCTTCFKFVPFPAQMLRLENFRLVGFDFHKFYDFRRLDCFKLIGENPLLSALGVKSSLFFDRYQ